MKFVKVTHYVGYSYDREPSFIIRMSDGNSYISNGCQFVRDTVENRDMLIKQYNCLEYLTELDNSPIDSHDLIESADYMMKGCEDLTDFEFVAPNLKSANFMLYWCEALASFELYAPNLKSANWMMTRCENLTKFKLDAPNLKSANWMMDGCKALTDFKLDAPEEIMEQYKHLIK